MTTVYTIGHSNLSIIRFLALLSMHGITCVADVRSVPFSRFYPQFNKDALAGSLREKNIRYVFMGDVLGGRIQDRECYLSKMLPDRKIHIAELVDFNILSHKTWFLSGIGELEAIAAKERTALLCSEEDPDRCHRHLLIARKLMEDGHSILHIRSDGRCEEASFEKPYEQMKME